VFLGKDWLPITSNCFSEERGKEQVRKNRAVLSRHFASSGFKGVLREVCVSATALDLEGANTLGAEKFSWSLVDAPQRLRGGEVTEPLRFSWEKRNSLKTARATEKVNLGKSSFSWGAGTSRNFLNKRL